MARGPKNHLKRLHSSRGWMLDRAVWVVAAGDFLAQPTEVRPWSTPRSPGWQCSVTSRSTARSALTRTTRLDSCISSPYWEDNENFRLIYDFDIKCRFTWSWRWNTARSVDPEKASFILIHDGRRTIRYPDTIIHQNYSIHYVIATGKVWDVLKFEPGNLCIVTGGRNRCGSVIQRAKHPGAAKRQGC